MINMVLVALIVALVGDAVLAWYFGRKIADIRTRREER